MAVIDGGGGGFYGGSLRFALAACVCDANGTTGPDTPKLATTSSTSRPEFGDAGLFAVCYTSLFSVVVGMVCKFLPRIQAPWASTRTD